MSLGQSSGNWTELKFDLFSAVVRNQNKLNHLDNLSISHQDVDSIQIRVVARSQNQGRHIVPVDQQCCPVEIVRGWSLDFLTKFICFPVPKNQTKRRPPVLGLCKDLWRNGQNTPKFCIFWKYIVGGAPITPWGWMGVDFLDHKLL